MKTIILPGFSIRNKEWAYQVLENLKTKEQTIVHEWETWSGEEHFSFEKEEARILDLVKNEKKVNFIAKSIGTKVLVRLLPKIKDKINKVILCGIPVNPIHYINGLKSINPNKILVIQNSRDPYMPYLPVRAFVFLINTKIRVIRKEASNHDYPYFEDFQNWLE